MTEDLTPEERAEFTLLLEGCLPDLYRLALWLARDPAAAEDLVQEASYRALRGFRQYERGTRFKAWLFRILHNHFLDLGRRARREPRAGALEDLEPAASSSERAIPIGPGDLDGYVEHVDEAVAAALAGLPEAYRTTFLFFALGGMTYEEIARALEVPVGTVMSRLFRARQRLQEELIEYATANGLVRRK